MKKIVSGYARVSTNSKDQENSFNNQRSFFEREVKKNKCVLFDFYADKGLTGTQLNNRAEFERMLHDAGIDVKKIRTDPRDKRKKFIHTVYELSDRKPLFDEIWIKNTSRLARNTLVSEIINLLRQKQVYVYFVEQNINTRDLSQDLLLKLVQVFDENESKDKSAKVRTGIKEGALKGVVHTNGSLYGYKYIQHENRLVVIPKEAKIIRYIFELYASGLGGRRIINKLNEKHMVTRNGKPFGKTTIRNILSNEKYAGLNNPLKYDNGLVFQKRTYAKVRQNYIVKESDRIPAIVSKDLFYQCRTILNTHVNHESQVGIYKGFSKYSGLVYCKKCGAVYYSNVDRGRHFYNCKTKKAEGTIKCDAPNISEAAIDKYIKNMASKGLSLALLEQQEQALKIVLTIIKERMSMLKSGRMDQIRNIDEKIEENKAVLSRYYDLYAIQTSGGEALKNRIKEIDSAIYKLQNKKIELSKDTNVIVNEIKEMFSLYSLIVDAHNGKTKYSERETIDMIDKIIIGRDQNGEPKIGSVIKPIKQVEKIIMDYDEDLHSEIVELSESEKIIANAKKLLSMAK